MHQGDRIPTFDCEGLDGRAWSPETLAGEEGLVVYFLSATCPYVLAQEDRLLDVARRWISKGVGVVALCSNSDPALAPGNSIDDIRRHAAEREYPFPYLYDQDQSVAAAFEATHTPDIFLFDGQLRLRYHGRLDDSWRDPSKVTRTFLEDEIRRMLARIDLTDAATPSFGCAIKRSAAASPQCPEYLVASEHLRILDHVEGTRVVNVLDGTIIEGSSDLVEFLRAFRHPTTLEQVSETLALPDSVAEVTRQLVEIGFLVPPGTEELAPLRARVSARRERVRSGSLVSILRMNMATGCNLRCTYCYMEAPSVNRAKADHAAVMSEDVARRAIEAFVRNASSNGRRHVSVRYIGGEPLLNRKVLRFSMDLVERLCQENGIAVTHLVCTNGLLLDRAFARFLKTLGDAHVLISLDGIRARNDRARVDIAGAGTHDRVVATIGMLIEEAVPLGVPAVVDRDGLGDVNAFLDELHALGVKRVGLNPSYRFGATDPTEEELQELVDGFYEARRHAQLLGLELSGKAYLPEWHALAGHLANCEAMGRALVVDPDGSVSLCDKLGEVVGHVDDLPAVFESDVYQRFAMRVRGNIETCAPCDARWVCNGGCLAEARASNGTDYLCGSHCDFIRRMASRILVPLFATE